MDGWRNPSVKILFYTRFIYLLHTEAINRICPVFEVDSLPADVTQNAPPNIQKDSRQYYGDAF